MKTSAIVSQFLCAQYEGCALVQPAHVQAVIARPSTAIKYACEPFAICMFIVTQKCRYELKDRVTARS